MIGVADGPGGPARAREPRRRDRGPARPAGDDRLWKAVNGLHPQRPMVAIDQLPWHELAEDPLLVNRCADPFNRGLEIDLRRTLYRWEHMRADMVVEPVLLIPKVLRLDGFGIEMHEETAASTPPTTSSPTTSSTSWPTRRTRRRSGPRRSGWMPRRRPASRPRHTTSSTASCRSGSRAGCPSTNQWPGLESQPETRALVHDWPTELLAGGANFWDTIEFWRGAEAVLARLRGSPGPTRTGSSTGWWTRLPRHARPDGGRRASSATRCRRSTARRPGPTSCPMPGSTRERPRAEDLWTMGMAQVFTSASPAMFREFEVDVHGSAGTSASASATTAAAMCWTGGSTSSGRSPTSGRSR